MRWPAILPAILTVILSLAPEPAAAQTTPSIAPSPRPIANSFIVAQAKRGPVAAKAEPRLSHAQLSAKINENTVTIISGNPNGGFLYTAYDMAAVLDDGDDMRVLPIVGRGGGQNIRDILHLKGVDMGIIHPHIVRYFMETGELGPSIDKRLAYIMPLFNDELHFVVREGIEKLEDLRGKKVNFSDAGSGTQISMRIMFKLLGIDVVEVNMGQTDAFEKMKVGEVEATTCTCAKPLRSVAGLKADSKFKLLSIPYTEALEEIFVPATFDSKDYPEIIKPGESVNTLAVPTVLGVYNWPKDTDRYRKVANFVQHLFNRFEELQRPPRQPKWRNVNIAAKVGVLQRFPAAQEWLDEAANRARQTSASVDPGLARQQAVRAAPGDAAEQERLFKQFLEWARQQRRN